VEEREKKASLLGGGGECYRARAKTLPRHEISLMHPIRVQWAGALFHLACWLLQGESHASCLVQFCLDHSLGQAPSHIPGSQLDAASWSDSWMQCGPLYQPNFHQLEDSTSHHWLADSQAAGCVMTLLATHTTPED